MARSRRYLPLICLLVPLNLLCAKLLLTPNRIETFDTEFLLLGWPWNFLEVAHIYPSTPSAVDCRVFWFFNLALDLLAVASIIAACTAILIWHLRRHGGRVQFSVRGLLIATALFAAVLGWWMNEWTYARRQEKFLAEFGPAIGELGKTYSPVWLQRLTGNDEIFARLTVICGGFDNETDAARWASALAGLPTLRCYWIRHDGPLREPEEILAPFPELRLGPLSCDDEAVETLVKLPRLETLDLRECDNLTMDLARRLPESRSLKHVILHPKTPPEIVAWLARRINCAELASENPEPENPIISEELNQQMYAAFKAALQRSGSSQSK